MNTKGNESYRRTHLRIESRVLELLEEEAYDRITVSRVCRDLSLNRSTFYAHFQDIYDVLDQMDARRAEELARTFKEAPGMGREAFVAVFDLIKEDALFYRVCLAQGRQIHAADEMYLDPDNLPESLIVMTEGISQTELLYFLDFFRAGMNAILARWLADGCLISSNELFDLMSKQFALFLSFDSLAA